MDNKQTPETKTIKDEFLSNQQYWDNVLKKEFEKETDRGAVIFAASLFDEALKNLLTNYLVTNVGSSDDLFETPNAPLSTFSSKISFSYRLGLISDKFARDLNLIRKIRNEFAHNIQGCDFSHSGIRSRVLELNKSSNIMDKVSVFADKVDKSSRNSFLHICSWMLTSIHNKIERIVPLTQAKTEFGYISEGILKDFKKFIDKKTKEGENETPKKDNLNYRKPPKG